MAGTSPAPRPPAPLSLAAVHQVAALARLELTDEQAARYQAQLGAILAHVDRLRTLDLTAVEPMASPLNQDGPMAADVPGPTLTPEHLMALAPASFESFVKVPKVLGDGGGA